MSKQQTLKFKRLSEDAVIPTKGTEGSAGYDLTLSEKLDRDVLGQGVRMAHFGVAVEIPEGYVGLLTSRSSLQKKGFSQANCVGIIDSDYRGELMAPYIGPPNSHLDKGTRIAQLVVVPYLMGPAVEVPKLTSTSRDDGGFGSTDAA